MASVWKMWERWYEWQRKASGCLEESHSSLCPNCHENSIELGLWSGRKDWCPLRGFVKLPLGSHPLLRGQRRLPAKWTPDGGSITEPQSSRRSGYSTEHGGWLGRLREPCWSVWYGHMLIYYPRWLRVWGRLCCKPSDEEFEKSSLKIIIPNKFPLDVSHIMKFGLAHTLHPLCYSNQFWGPDHWWHT